MSVKYASPQTNPDSLLLAQARGRCLQPRPCKQGGQGTPPPPPAAQGCPCKPGRRGPKVSQPQPGVPAGPRSSPALRCPAPRSLPRFGVPVALVTHQRPCPSRVPRCWFCCCYLMYFAAYLSGGQLGCSIRRAEAKGAVLSLVPVPRRRWNPPLARPV